MLAIAAFTSTTVRILTVLREGNNTQTIRALDYSQCQPGSPTTTVTTTTSTTTTTAPTSSTCSGSLTKFKYFGVNQAGAEFGNNVIPVGLLFRLTLEETWY